MSEGLTRVSLDASLEWDSKTVTTDPPRYVPHAEWSLVVRLAGSVPLRAVVLLSLGDETSWGLVADPPSKEMQLRARFSPCDWKTSDDVQVGFGWQRHTVTDATLKRDPRSAVKITLPPAPQTGQLISVAEVVGHGIELGMLVVAEQDTEPRRMHRWRIKPAFAAMLPAHLAQLTTGKQSGS